MEILVENYSIGLVFKGFLGIIILFYLIMEIVFIYHTRMTFLQMILVNIGLKKRISKVIPPWWYIHEMSELSSINKPILEYRVWVEFRLKNDTNSFWKRINGWIHLDKLGRVYKSDLESLFEDSDKEVQDSIKKRYNREKLLKDLNI